MTTFVADCRREWRRLGVPAGTANEMAADLEADLAEAEADGVSPEEVLGNGYFDPASFAAAWASARGLGDPDPAVGRLSRRRPVALVVGAIASGLVLVLGIALLILPRHGAASFAAVSVRRGVLPSLPPLRSVFVTPHHALVSGPGVASAIGGLVLIVLGAIGLGVVLWVRRSRPPHRHAPDHDGDVGMPSFL